MGCSLAYSLFMPLLQFLYILFRIKLNLKSPLLAPFCLALLLSGFNSSINCFTSGVGRVAASFFPCAGASRFIVSGSAFGVPAISGAFRIYDQFRTGRFFKKRIIDPVTVI